VLHNLLIGLHATAGVVAFVAGVASLTLSTDRSWRFQAYAVSLIALVVFMVAAVAADWRTLDGSAGWIYLGLIALGLYMLLRAAQAHSRMRHRPDGWRPKYIDDIGFTLISLFDGFVIVSAIDLKAPVWLVIVIAVLGVAVGIFSMNRLKAHVAAVA
jgi:cell division protein FtsW (lipid II flippase)